MLQVETIASFDDPRLIPYRTMKRQFDHAAQEIFIAEGEKVVRRLLESDLEVTSLLLPEKWLCEYEPLISARREKFPVFTASKKVLEQLTGFTFYQGLLAVGRIPKPLSLDEALAKNPRPYFFAAVDGVSSGENMGALIRNCVAFGVQALIFSDTSCTPYLRRAVRNSMGTVFKLPLIFSQNLPETLHELRAKNVSCIAAHPHTNQKTIFQTKFSDNCCILFGSEGVGITKDVLAACDDCVAIPMQNDVDSLNVGGAAAVFFYEVARQRAVHGDSRK